MKETGPCFPLLPSVLSLMGEDRRGEDSGSWLLLPCDFDAEGHGGRKEEGGGGGG